MLGKKSRTDVLRSITFVLRVVVCHVKKLLAGMLSLGRDIGRTEPPARAPYVQSVTASSGIIAWVSEEPSIGVVEYGRTPKLGSKGLDTRVGRRHAVRLSDLAPDSTYHYQVTGGDETLMRGHFRTAPTRNDSRFTFAVIGDSGDGGKSQLAMAGLLERIKPDFILHTGDVVYPAGAQHGYEPHFFEPYRKIIRGVPIFPVLGNHDVRTNDGAPYLENFHLPRNNPQQTKRYYSFDWGDAHFVALDSELYYWDCGGDPEEQKSWLELDLASTRQRWKLVFLHRPIYSSSRHGGDRKIREDLEPVFARHGVHVVFSGHDHNYERTLPIGGTTYVVSGGGGKDLYRAGRSEWTAFSESVHHAIYARVDGERLTLEAVEQDGTLVERSHLTP